MAGGETKGSVQVAGEYLVPAARDVVWLKLQDPEVLALCIRGCERVTLASNGEYNAEFSFGIGPFRKRLDARLTVEETAPPGEYRLHAETRLRGLGNARGSARVLLDCRQTETLLAYTADVVVQGWFAGLGDAVLTAAADRYMSRFFQRFATIVV
jgi:carbon monoxide dehydrogenase subunit G